jgi:hypothetical protein
MARASTTACGILSDSSYPTGVSLLTEDAVEAA